jgi:hypothetical protein
MERLVRMMCWLFNSEQHLEEIYSRKERECKVLEVEVTF